MQCEICETLTNQICLAGIMARMLNLALLALCGLAVLAEAKTGVRIIPEPNGQVGMMRSESKYFQCIGSRFGKHR